MPSESIGTSACAVTGMPVTQAEFRELAYGVRQQVDPHADRLDPYRMDEPAVRGKVYGRVGVFGPASRTGT